MYRRLSTFGIFGLDKDINIKEFDGEKGPKKPEI
jgi:hypothetical protein